MWCGHPNRCQVLSRIYAYNLYQSHRNIWPEWLGFLSVLQHPCIIYFTTLPYRAEITLRAPRSTHGLETTWPVDSKHLQLQHACTGKPSACHRLAKGEGTVTGTLQRRAHTIQGYISKVPCIPNSFASGKLKSRIRSE